MAEPDANEILKDGKVIMEVTNEGSVHYPGKEKHAVIYRTGKFRRIDEKKEKK